MQFENPDYDTVEYNVDWYKGCMGMVKLIAGMRRLPKTLITPLMLIIV